MTLVSTVATCIAVCAIVHPSSSARRSAFSVPISRNADKSSSRTELFSAKTLSTVCFIGSIPLRLRRQYQTVPALKARGIVGFELHQSYRGRLKIELVIGQPHQGNYRIE